MADVGGQIFKRYGGKALIAAVAFAVAIWAVGHYAAAPGGTVSILWGLVEYTKPLPLVGPSPGAPLSRQTSRNPGSGAAPSNREPTTLQMQPRVSLSNPDEAAVALRSERGLRELTALESRRVVSEVPPRTFFFMYSGYLQAYGDDPRARIERVSVDRFRQNRDSDFEFHYLSEDALLLIGYVTEANASQVARLDGETPHSVIVAPIPWDAMNTIVSIPISRWDDSSQRRLQVGERESLSVLDLTIR